MSAFGLNDWPPFRQEALNSIEASLRAGKLVDGPNTARLESEWAEHTGAQYCLSCSSGTAALYMALAAVGVAGKEVIVPAFTFSGSIFPIIMAGAKPVYADVDPQTYCVTAESVAAVVTKDTAAILPVHIHGYPVDLAAIRAAIPDQVAIVEDACQAVGSTLPSGQRAGRFGIAGGYSLNQTKALPGGEGGLIVTDDRDFFDALHTLRRFGERWDEISPRTYMVEDRRGGNYRIDEFCAAVTLSHLPHLMPYTEQARKNAAILDETLGEIGWLSMPARDPGHSWQKFRVRAPDRRMRDKAFAALSDAGLPVCHWQVATMPDHPGFRDFDANVPEARALLEDSFLFFTERNPLHCQSAEVVAAVAMKSRRILQALN